MLQIISDYKGVCSTCKVPLSIDAYPTGWLCVIRVSYLIPPYQVHMHTCVLPGGHLHVCPASVLCINVHVLPVLCVHMHPTRCSYRCPYMSVPYLVYT